MLDPYGIGSFGWALFGVLLVCSIGVGIAAGLNSLWKDRERRDGKR